jgi:fermentation-respiration switch protein FrsA (DUF1100 family)
MSALKWIAILLGAGYLGLAALMYLAQRALMYFPETARTAPAAAGFPQAEEVVLDTADGEKVIVWHVPPRGGEPVVLYLHGNGGALQHRVPRFRKLVADGVGLVALSYRGYAGSTGKPTEAGFINDGRAAYDFAAARYPAASIAVWGESLGTGAAIALATEKPVARLLLQAPFTSAVDVASAIYWFLPVRLLMKDQFRSDERIGKVTAPVLILHGERDVTVPIGYGERLHQMIGAPKRFVRFPDGGHNNLDQYGATEAALKFLADRLD